MSGALPSPVTSTPPERAMTGGAADSQSRSNSTIPEESESSQARTSLGGGACIAGSPRAPTVPNGGTARQAVSSRNWCGRMRTTGARRFGRVRASPMRMTHSQMYSRFAAGDPAWNGRFFTGVLTTGVYCLPSCRARKARAENVRFYPSCEAAREAGFRPCLKCHPDDFARGSDPVLETIEALVAEVRADPAAFADARSIVRRSGFGTTRCFELFRQHFHSTPADLLLRARLEWARRRLIESDAPVSRVAVDAGFESISVF